MAAFHQRHGLTELVDLSPNVGDLGVHRAVPVQRPSEEPPATIKDEYGWVAAGGLDHGDEGVRIRHHAWDRSGSDHLAQLATSRAAVLVPVD